MELQEYFTIDGFTFRFYACPHCDDTKFTILSKFPEHSISSDLYYACRLIGTKISEVKNCYSCKYWHCLGSPYDDLGHCENEQIKRGWFNGDFVNKNLITNQEFSCNLWEMVK